jgi:hypothetical protein
MTTTIAVWLLVAVASNGGTTTIAQHPSQEECEMTKAEVSDALSRWIVMACVPAKVVGNDRGAQP